MKTNVETNVETNVGLMFWARWPAGGPVGPGRGGAARPAAAQPRTAGACPFGPCPVPLNAQLCPLIVKHCVYVFRTFPVFFFWSQDALRQRQPTRAGNSNAELHIKHKCYKKT